MVFPINYTFNWDNNQWIGNTVTTLTPGVHTVVVTDINGCTDSSFTNINPLARDTVLTHEPPALCVMIDDNQTFCLIVLELIQRV